jgi:hypothetical protein
MAKKGTPRKIVPHKAARSPEAVVEIGRHVLKGLFHDAPAVCASGVGKKRPAFMPWPFIRGSR